MMRRVLYLFSVSILSLLILPHIAHAQTTKPPADIVFIIDESGSMGDDIAAVKSNVDSIATQLEAFLDPQYGLVGFGATSGHGGVGNGLPHTHANLTTKSNFSTALNELVANGGFEPGVEATTYAINNLTGWRSGAGACLILITDEDSDGGDVATARTALDSRNATFFGIVAVGAGNTSSTYGPGAGSLSAHTGGEIFNITSFRTNPQPVLDALLTRCIASIIEGITLAPTSATTDLGTPHTVTASLKDNLLNPLTGVEVRFEITAGPNAGLTGTDTSDAAGEATFTYSDNGTAGIDTIVACFTDSSGTEKCSSPVTNEWIASTAIVDLDNTAVIGRLVSRKAAPNAPAGTFFVTGTFENVSTVAEFEKITFKVLTLTNGNLLLNTDSGVAGGVGAEITVPTSAFGPDDILSPGESFDITYEIGLAVLQSFSFFVEAHIDLVGGGSIIASSVTAVENLQYPMNFDDLEAESVSSQTIYLPMVIR